MLFCRGVRVRVGLLRVRRRESVVSGKPARARACQATSRAGHRCRSTVVGLDGFCSIHRPGADPAELGRLGGIASGKARRQRAMRVRERVEDARVEARVDRAQEELRELELELRESQRRVHRDLLERRERFIAAAREEMREKLSAERAELRRLRRQRSRLESKSP